MALSLANVCFVAAWFRPLYDANFILFNNPTINNATLLALLTNIIGLAGVFWLVLQAWRRWNIVWFRATVNLLFLAILFIPADFIRGQTMPTHSLTGLLQLPVVILIVFVVGIIGLWQHRRIARAAAIIVAWLFPLAVYNLGRISLLTIGVIHLRVEPAEFHPVAFNPVRAGQPRVVWMVFDEMDYRLVFENRPKGVELPELDIMRAESLNATAAVSPNDKTVLSMPSLIFGRRISVATVTNGNDLALQFVITNGSYLCSQPNPAIPSVFAVARQMGINTAAIGWYLPYSKLFGRDLNYCSWFPYPGFEPAHAATFGVALQNQLACLTGPLHIRQGFVNMYQQSLADSKSLVTNNIYGLILLHFYPPHLPALYLPAEQGFTLRNQGAVTGYFNNLMLADRTLGELRRALEKSGEWDRTWIILSADHAWRTSSAYDGQRDYRVPFLVKTPGVSHAATTSKAFNTTVTHDLILAILARHIDPTTQSVAAWLEANAPDRPVFTKGQFNHPWVGN